MSLVTPINTLSLRLIRRSDIRTAVVLTRLRQLGADEYDLLLPETRCLPTLLQDDEIIFGVVYGKYHKASDQSQGRGALVVTNYRLIFLDKKPLFHKHEYIPFSSVGGVQVSTAKIGDTITVGTRSGDIIIRTYNRACARQFVESIEDMLFANAKGWIT